MEKSGADLGKAKDLSEKNRPFNNFLGDLENRSAGQERGVGRGKTAISKFNSIRRDIHQSLCTLFFTFWYVFAKTLQYQGETLEFNDESFTFFFQTKMRHITKLEKSRCSKSGAAKNFISDPLLHFLLLGGMKKNQQRQ